MWIETYKPSIDNDEEKEFKEKNDNRKEKELKQTINGRLPYLQENPDKIKLDDSNDTIKDAFNVAKDTVNWKWKDSIPSLSLKIDNFEMQQLWNKITCTFKSAKWDVNIDISGFDEEIKWEPKNKLSVEVSWDLKNIPELNQLFPNGISSPANIDDMSKLIKLIDTKVKKDRWEAHGNIKKEQEKKEQESKAKADLETTILMLRIRENEPLDGFMNFVMAWEWFTPQDWDLRKAVVALWILMRNYWQDEIEDMLKNSYEKDNQEDTQKNSTEKNMLSGEHIINYLSAHPNVIWDQKLINLAMDKATPADADKKIFLSLN